MNLFQETGRPFGEFKVIKEDHEWRAWVKIFGEGRGDWKVNACASVIDDQSKLKSAVPNVSRNAIVQRKVENQAEQALGQGLHVKGQTRLRMDCVLIHSHGAPE